MKRLFSATSVALALTACGPAEPPAVGGPPVLRRLTEAQYRNIVADMFGSDIRITGDADPIDRLGGLVAVGAGYAAIMPTGFERYEARARAIAAQVMAPANHDTLIPCQPAATEKPDDTCAGKFLGAAGRYLLRRPLTEDQLANYVAIARNGAEGLGNFHDGLGTALAALLVSPSFLYVKDVTEPDRDGGQRLDGYSTAARLSFLLWNSTPDDALLNDAATGAIHDRDVLRGHARRMIGSPRVERGVRAFFADMLHLDRLDTLQKDSAIYPAFSLAAAKDSGEQTLRTISQHLVGQNGDYRDLFLTPETFVTAALGLVYQIPVTDPSGWSPYSFAGEAGRGGIQNQLSFLALHSHPGKTSPTLRGRAIRELLMCQTIPDPPGDVSFEAFNDPNNPGRTARDRLAAHSKEPSCAGCHKLTDPIGLTLEKFDGAGQMRETEDGHAIDVGGDLDGAAYQGSDGLAHALHDSPATTACAVQRLFEYAIGRKMTSEERPLLGYFNEGFAADKYRFTSLLERVATSAAVYKVTP